MSDDNTRVIGYCAECGLTITDDLKDCHCDEEGNFFDSVECALEHHGIHLMEV